MTIVSLGLSIPRSYTFICLSVAPSQSLTQVAGALSSLSQSMSDVPELFPQVLLWILWRQAKSMRKNSKLTSFSPPQYEWPRRPNNQNSWSFPMAILVIMASIIKVLKSKVRIRITFVLNTTKDFRQAYLI